MQEVGTGSPPTGEAGATRFSITRWSVVLRASRPGTAEAAEALEILCRTYWYPVYAYVRSRRYGPEDAQDLVQEFFARLLEKNWLAGIEPDTGRFRCFLLTAVKRFLLNEYDRRTTLKRGGDRIIVSIDDQTEGRYCQEPATHETPEEIFERRWALAVLDQALGSLRSQLIAAGKVKEFELLGRFLSREAEPGEYAQIGSELGLSGSAVAVSVHRLRQRYREVLRECVANTMAEPLQVDEELRQLIAALQ
ncbi:MAG TPA: sigma-70 family RNA polymerase sigma factor [Verrucomicrobiae bacterium]|nr:sigma-70 family RNA polymerase sigma factor [Verrucomicrobiae bacterium]